VKRLWIACAILLAVFAATLCNTSYLAQFTGRLTDTLAQAEQRAEAGDWEGAERSTRQALEEWDSHTAYLHILLRHTDVDEINVGFREVLEFIQCREEGEYSAANECLMVRIGLLYEAEQLSVKNVL